VAVLFGVSRTLVKKLLRQRRETGSVAPKPHGGGHTPKVEAKKREAVRAYIVAGIVNFLGGLQRCYLVVSHPGFEG
jgi:hypothetical protein